MNLLKRILLKNNKAAKALSGEDKYYQDLFIKNKRWNTAEPNEEELTRWLIINDFFSVINAEFGKRTLKILDLGCGRGWLANKMSVYGNVTGVEPVDTVVEYGKTLFPHLDLRQGTSKDLLAHGAMGSFDIVVSSEVIEHIPDSDKPAFVKDINLLLKPDGFSIITTPRKDIQEEWLEYCDPDQPVEDWMYEITLKELFIAAGFIDKKLERYACSPKPSAPELEVYQLWLFQKN